MTGDKRQKWTREVYDLITEVRSVLGKVYWDDLDHMYDKGYSVKKASETYMNVHGIGKRKGAHQDNTHRTNNPQQPDLPGRVRLRPWRADRLDNPAISGAR